MANFNLAGQKIKDTYSQVAQVNGTTLVNGSGTATPIATSSIVNFPTEVSRSAAAAGFGSGGGTATWPVSGTPSGLVSSSAQVNLASAYGSASNAVNALSSSHAELADYATSAGVASTANQAALVNITATSTNANYPVMFVSSNGYQSPRIDTETLGIYYNPSTNRLTTSLINGNTITATTAFVGNLTGTATSASYATHALSASYAPAASLPSGLVSSSAQISYTGITNVPSGVVSSSAQVNLAAAYGTAATATSASYALTASYVPGIAAPGLVSGTGTNSMKSADTLTSVTASASGQDTIALGDNAVAESIGAISIGKNSEARGDYSVAIGYNADVFDTVRDYSTAVGAESRLAQNSVALGYHAYGVGSDCVALGKNTNVAGFGAVAIGADAQAFANNGLSIGNNIQANNYNGETNINGIIIYNNDGKEHCKITHTIVAPTNTLTGAGSTVTPSGGQSNFWFLANGGATTTIANPTNIADGTTYIFKITNGTNITWGSAYKWEGGTPPSLSTGTDIVTLVSIGGSELYGTFISNLS